MNTTTRQHILKLIQESGPLGPTAIAQQLNLSTQMVHRHLKKLLAADKIRKLGSPPRVLYRAVDGTRLATPSATQLDSTDVDYINEHYMSIRPDGQVLEGMSAFEQWAYQTKR